MTEKKRPTGGGRARKNTSGVFTEEGDRKKCRIRTHIRTSNLRKGQLKRRDTLPRKMQITISPDPANSKRRGIENPPTTLQRKEYKAKDIRPERGGSNHGLKVKKGLTHFSLGRAGKTGAKGGGKPSATAKIKLKNEETKPKVPQTKRNHLKSTRKCSTKEPGLRCTVKWPTLPRKPTSSLSGPD